MLEQCDNVLPGHGPAMSIAAKLRDIADSLDGGERQDVYGVGEYLQSFETEIADMFGNSMRFDIARLAPFMERLLSSG